MDKQEDAPAFEQIDTAAGQNFDFEAEKLNLKGVDDAFRFTADRAPISWTAEEERKLLWKIDLRLIPLVSGTR